MSDSTYFQGRFFNPREWRVGEIEILVERREGRAGSLRTFEPGERGDLLDIDDLGGGFMLLSEEEATRAYAQSYWMVRNLVEEAGWGAISDLLSDLHADRELGFDAAFSDFFGESPAEYLDRWYDSAFR